MDQTGRDIELLLCNLKPHVVFFDFAYWLPKLARQLGIKTVYLSVVNLVMKAYIAGKNYEGAGNIHAIRENIARVITWLPRFIHQASSS